VVLDSGTVIGASGFDFVIEAANPEIFAIVFQADIPGTAAFISA
jgi:hypothetical protein